MSKHSSAFSTIGMGNEKEFFVDNLSVLLNSGMDVLTSLRSIASETKSSRLRSIIGRMVIDLEDGDLIWRSMDKSGLFTPQVIALARVGEESGRLVDNLRIIALQQQKDRMFKAKLIGAVTYPALIVVLSIGVGMWSLFSLLPQLAMTFSSLDVPLPVLTQVFISVGEFAEAHWRVMIPAIIISAFAALFFGFIYSGTRFIGQAILFHIPGLGRLLKDTETGRIGYLLGTLLSSGVGIVDALRSVARAANFASYSRFYSYLADRLEEGDTFSQAFQAHRRSRKILTIPMQQLIVASEQSGGVPQAFLSIGEVYQFRADLAAKSLAVILEPLLLVLVGAGVLLLALAVIMPIYSLMGSLG